MKEGSVEEMVGPSGETEIGQSTGVEIQELIVLSRFRMCTAVLWDAPQGT